MLAWCSLLLAIAAACLSHICVRYCTVGKRRGLCFTIVTLLGASFYCGTALGGFWSGFYTLLSVYFLACIAVPWLDLLLRGFPGERRAT